MLSNRNSIKQIFYDPFNIMSFTNEECFLCGKYLNVKTSEHVFPKWLLNEFNLWNKTITLLNQTSISYKRLKIPCCKQCNNVFLSKVEKIISKKYKEGFKAFFKLEELIIYQWIGKIFYGLLFRELSLIIDQSLPKKEYIISPEMLERYKTFHGFLQSVRIPFKFSNFIPWSIFILNLHTDKRFNENFDYHDSTEFLTFSIRMKNIGIIACLGDNGAQKDILSDYWEKIQSIKLLPIQFDELCAKVTYKSSLMNRNPKYITILPVSEKEETIVTGLPLQGLSSKPIYNEWNQNDYAKILLSYIRQYGFCFEDIFKEPNLVMSFIEEKNKIKVLNCKGEIIKYI